VKNRICPSCNLRKVQRHHSSKWCSRCSLEKRTHPKSNMTADQIAAAKEMIGKIPREEIAERIGVSEASLKRAFRGVRLGYRQHLLARPELVQQVCAYYEEHGGPRTQKAFPGVNVRSITERYKLFKPRTIRWTDEQLIELAKMGGIISISAQAKFFNRPNAYAGSIKSVWSKKFGMSSAAIHGMSHCQARHLVSKNCPYLYSNFWISKRSNRRKCSRKLYLWVDMEKNLIGDLPSFIRDGIVTMSNFQRWLFKSKDPKSEILKMLRDRHSGEDHGWVEGYIGMGAAFRPSLEQCPKRCNISGYSQEVQRRRNDPKHVAKRSVLKNVHSNKSALVIAMRPIHFVNIGNLTPPCGVVPEDTPFHFSMNWLQVTCTQCLNYKE
jgi:hypothetical protein